MLTRADLLPEGVDGNPEASYTYNPPDRKLPDAEGRGSFDLTAANNAHVVMVEVDRETGQVGILKYVIADDCGVRLNPAVVEGMIQGAVAQGVGLDRSRRTCLRRKRPVPHVDVYGLLAADDLGSADDREDVHRDTVAVFAHGSQRRRRERGAGDTGGVVERHQRRAPTAGRSVHDDPGIAAAPVAADPERGSMIRQSRIYPEEEAA